MIKKPRLPQLTWLTVFLTLLVGFVVYQQKPGYFPSLRVETGLGVDFYYLNDAQKTLEECQATLAKVEKALTPLCLDCKTTPQCHRTLPMSMAEVFTETTSISPMAHTPSGVLLFESKDEKLAHQLCDSSVTALKAQHPQAQARCYPANSEHPAFRAQNDNIDLRDLSYAGLALLLSLLISKFTTWLIIRYEHLHAHFSHDHTNAGPQKFHAQPTPRIGGIPLMIGLLISTVLLQSLPYPPATSQFGLLLLAALPVYLGGLTEDITKKVGVRERLLLSMLSGLFGCWLLDAIIPAVQFANFDPIPIWQPLAIAFTVFAVGGVANALNIIDGYNGLAAGFGVIASIALAVAAAMHGDSFLLYANLAMVGALLGFLVWNWPQGKIFLGDGGAYLLGFWLAEMSILLLVRNPGVSVWLPMAIMIYPVFETLFSIYRRKFKRRTDPGQPDATHLHQLVYKRLVRIHVGSRIIGEKIARNSRVAPYFWIITSLFCGLALLFQDTPWVLQLLTLGFAVMYVALYQTLKSWRVPRQIIYRKN